MLAPEKYKVLNMLGILLTPVIGHMASFGHYKYLDSISDSQINMYWSVQGVLRVGGNFYFSVKY